MGERGARQRLEDLLEHRFRLAKDFVVPEPNDTPTCCAEIGCALVVMGFPISVLSTIEFDDDTLRETGEIGEVRADGMLAAELVSVQPSRAQSMPKPQLGIGGGFPQLPRKGDAPHPDPLPVMRGEGV